MPTDVAAWEVPITVGSGGHRSDDGPVARARADRVPASRRVHPGGVDEIVAVLRTGSAAGRAVRPARPAVVLAVALSLAVVAGGCGGGGAGGAGGGDDESAVGGATVPDRVDVPLGTEPEAVAPYIDDLLTSYNTSVNEIAAAPTLANDPAGPALEAYLGLFEHDSAAASQAVAFWRNQAAVGDSTRRYSPDRPAFDTRIDGPVETVSEDEVTFPTCVEVAFETVNAQGQRVDVEPGASVPGEGTAVRIGDGWRLRRLDQFAGTEGCRGEG